MKKRYTTTMLSLLAFAAAYAQDAPTILTEPAKGDTINLYRTSAGFYASNAGAAPTSDTGDLQRLVFGEDGAVYLQNPINAFFQKSWIKGTKGEDNTLVFQLPQAIYSEDDFFSGGITYGYASCMHKETTENKTTYVMNDDEHQTLTYKWENNKLTMMGGDDFMLGCTFNGNKWSGYGETSNTGVQTENTGIRPSADAKVFDGLMLYMDTDKQSQMVAVKYAIDGDNVYIGDLSDNIKGYWIKGDMKDNVATFPSTSFIGIDQKTYSYVYASSAVMGKGKDDFGEDIDKPCISSEPMEFTYNPADNSFFNKGMMIIHKSADDDRASYIFDTYNHPQVNLWENKPGTPLPPIFTSYMPYDVWSGYAGIEYKLSFYSTDGNYLDPDCLYINVYLDGKLLTLTPDEFRDVDSDMTDIPYSLEGYDFVKLSENNRRFYFYQDIQEKIGMEALYINGDTRLGSGVTEYYINGTDGIDSNIANEKRIESVEFTDLNGTRISRPTGKGIYIRTIKYADGSKVSKKLVK